ncbi:DNA-binding transcriptional LysR family regulator [Streptosporangium sandarakinum]|uniref:DNA-binding transcriptional LysR family regulator n=1 Tax=Streptosporangium sandarakinum TaxID=1260955 RepID=A0A852V2Y5_9ACTN|nr:DNA-binding transcriptional LysR family regulator [Streptosporangium sandarakinum]
MSSLVTSSLRSFVPRSRHRRPLAVFMATLRVAARGLGSGVFPRHFVASLLRSSVQTPAPPRCVHGDASCRGSGAWVRCLPSSLRRFAPSFLGPDTGAPSLCSWRRFVSRLGGLGPVSSLVTSSLRSFVPRSRHRRPLAVFMATLRVAARGLGSGVFPRHFVASLLRSSVQTPAPPRGVHGNTACRGSGAWVRCLPSSLRRFAPSFLGPDTGAPSLCSWQHCVSRLGGLGPVSSLVTSSLRSFVPRSRHRRPLAVFMATLRVAARGLGSGVFPRHFVASLLRSSVQTPAPPRGPGTGAPS